MKTIIMLILICLLNSCTKDNSIPGWTRISTEDSLFVRKMIRSHDTLDSSRVMDAIRVTSLLSEYLPGSEGHIDALKDIASVANYRGPLIADSLLNYLNLGQQFLCHQYDYNRELAIVSPVITWKKYRYNIPICFISCPLSHQMGQSRMHAGGYIMINMYQIMSIYKLVINTIPQKYHISPERWVISIIAQEMYHANTANAGTEFESDLQSMDYASKFYLAFRLMNMGNFFYEDLEYIRQSKMMSSGYFDSHEIYYNCCTQFVPKKLGDHDQYDNILNTELDKCPESKIEFDICMIETVKSISTAAFVKILKLEPNILEKVYPCIMEKRV